MPNRHALAPTAPPANDDYCDADETRGEHFFPNCCEPSVCGKSVIGVVERPKCDGVVVVSPAIYRFRG